MITILLTNLHWPTAWTEHSIYRSMMYKIQLERCWIDRWHLKPLGSQVNEINRGERNNELGFTGKALTHREKERKWVDTFAAFALKMFGKNLFWLCRMLHWTGSKKKKQKQMWALLCDHQQGRVSHAIICLNVEWQRSTLEITERINLSLYLISYTRRRR